MGKKSKYPAYSGGSVVVNGKTKAYTQRIGNDVVSKYYMSDAEQKIQDSILDNMDSSLENLFNITSPQRHEWQNTLDAMKREGISNINDIYTPMENNLKNDIAMRFGNLDNSTFLNNLKKITDNKSKAVAQLGNDLALMQDDLYTNELQNRINTLNFLDGFNTSFNNNMLNYMGLANQNSSSGNSYNQMAYNSKMSNNNLMNKLAVQALQLGKYFY